MKLFDQVFFARDSRIDHFRALDGLRGLAVLLVILSHASGGGVHLFGLLDLSKSGKMGVYLFFMLSAYLLDRQIAVALKDGRTTLKYWINYAFRRFLRIYPLFFIALMLNYYFTQQGYFFAIKLENSKVLFDHIFLQQGRNIFWSIPVEFKYYLLSPIILICLNRITKFRIKETIIIIIVMTACISMWIPSLKLSNISTFKYLPIFLIGTLISIVEVFSSYFENLETTVRKNLNIMGFVSLIGILLTIKSLYSLMFSSSYPFHHPIYYIYYAMLWSFALISCKYSDGAFKRIFLFKPLRFLGVISFSAYLSHQPILVFVNRSGYFNDSLKLVSAIAIIVIISTISYLMIERPLSKLRIS